MAARSLVLEPDPILRKAADPVDEMDGAARVLIDDLLATMATEDGVGLAAPQIGVSRRVIVVRIDPAGDGVFVTFALVNPAIVESEGAEWGNEGCLSVPRVVAAVKRARRVVVEALDRDGQIITIDAVGHAARVLQHEIDHLDGITILRHLTPVKRKQYLRRQKKRR
jgi:peptide deformylase